MINKEDLINEIYGRCAVESRSLAEEILYVLVQKITTAVQSGEEVKVNGLGIFSTKQMRARIARNPKTGAPVAVPPHMKIKFRASQSFVDLVAGVRD